MTFAEVETLRTARTEDAREARRWRDEEQQRQLQHAEQIAVLQTALRSAVNREQQTRQLLTRTQV